MDSAVMNGVCEGLQVTEPKALTGRPSQRRNLARACIDFVQSMTRSERQMIGAGWQGERLFEKQAKLGILDDVSTPVSSLEPSLQGIEPAQVQEHLKLSQRSLDRFSEWAQQILPDGFSTLYVAEGGTVDERRNHFLNVVQQGIDISMPKRLVVCGAVDPQLARRLRAFNPVFLDQLETDVCFSAAELTYLCMHEGEMLYQVGADDFTELFDVLRPSNASRSSHDHWSGTLGIGRDEAAKRLQIARQCLQLGGGDRVEGLLADRGLGQEADLYLALGHFQASEFREADFYYQRLLDSKFPIPQNIENLFEEGPRDADPLAKSFALNDLDLKLRPYLGEQPGIFIEAGGNNGIAQSNTLYFERNFGWRGLLIEGIPDLARACRENRPRAWVENYALVPFGFGDPTVSMTYCNLMSVVDGAMKTEAEELEHIRKGEAIQNVSRYQVDVEAKTLSSVLDSYGLHQIDLLSLDVEGFELQVLEGLDLERHAPTWMLIEARYREEIDSHLSSHYEVVDELSHHDVLYRRRGV